MSLKNLRNKKEGFTIIEVLIVLAIAGLILLIVFLAVPALQRNSRNTQRKNDVSALLGSINEYTANNGGNLPTTPANAMAGARLGYYSGSGTGQGQVTLTTTAAQSALGTVAADDRVRIVNGATCSGAATVAGSARQVAVQYLTEVSGGFSATCQDS